MQFVCDVPRGRTWFAIETQAEADAEAALMGHAVDRHFERAWSAAAASYKPIDPHGIGRDIGLKDHVRRTMPLFLTLRDGEGAGLATAMLPPRAKHSARFRIIIVGPNNSDPYAVHSEAIAALGRHLSLDLPRENCFPYG
jgi:hypothetical protein